MSTQILLCDRIERLPFYSAENDSNGIPTPKAGKDWILINEAKGTFTEEGKETSAGLQAVQKLEISCELTPDESNQIQAVPHIYRLQFSDGSLHVWGSLKVPVLCPSIKGSVLQKKASLERLFTKLEF